jgi:hypothetical protein
VYLKYNKGEVDLKETFFFFKDAQLLVCFEGEKKETTFPLFPPLDESAASAIPKTAEGQLSMTPLPIHICRWSYYNLQT